MSAGTISDKGGSARVTLLLCRCMGHPWYLAAMKVAISVPEPVFDAAELLAQELSMSRLQHGIYAVT